MTHIPLAHLRIYTVYFYIIKKGDSMKFVLFAGSLRSGSFNKQLLKVIAKYLQSQGHETHLIDLKSLNIPLYDGDLESSDGLPVGIKTLASHINDSHAVIISSPEYNAAISGVLKNTFDWLSRIQPLPLQKKPIFISAASSGGFAGIRSMTHARVTLDAIGAYVYPQNFGLAKAHEAFKTEDTPTTSDTDLPTLADESNQKRLETLLTDFIIYAKKLNS